MLFHPDRPSAPCLALLDRHLAALIDLHGQVKHTQWNLRGPGVGALQTPLDRMATALGYYTDLMANQASALGGTAQGTIQVAAARSFLAPYPPGLVGARPHALALALALEMLGGSLRQAAAHATTAGDAETADLLVEVARGIDREICALRPFTAAPPTATRGSWTQPPSGAETTAPDHQAHRASDLMFTARDVSCARSDGGRPDGGRPDGAWPGQSDRVHQPAIGAMDAPGSAP